MFISISSLSTSEKEIIFLRGFGAQELHADALHSKISCLLIDLSDLVGCCWFLVVARIGQSNPLTTQEGGQCLTNRYKSSASYSLSKDDDNSDDKMDQNDDDSCSSLQLQCLFRRLYCLF